MEYKYLEEDLFKQYNSSEPLNFARIKDVRDFAWCYLAKFCPQGGRFTGVDSIYATSRECIKALKFLISDVDFSKYYYGYYSQTTSDFTKRWEDRLVVRINPNDLSLWQENGIKQIIYAPIEDTIFILRRKDNVFINEIIQGNRFCNENNARIDARVSTECFNLSEEEKEEFRNYFITKEIEDQPLIMYIVNKVYNDPQPRLPEYESITTLKDYLKDDCTINFYVVEDNEAKLKEQFKVKELPESEYVNTPNAKIFSYYIEPNTLYTAYRKYFDRNMPFLKKDGAKLERNK